jgi:pimeloyl-ACP methyl ester carboxylesterase
MDEKRANAIAQMNPKIKLYHVPQASHEVHRDKFDVFIQAVREFLAS